MNLSEQLLSRFNESKEQADQLTGQIRKLQGKINSSKDQEATYRKNKDSEGAKKELEWQKSAREEISKLRAKRDALLGKKNESYLEEPELYKSLDKKINVQLQKQAKLSDEISKLKRERSRHTDPEKKAPLTKEIEKLESEISKLQVKVDALRKQQDGIKRNDEDYSHKGDARLEALNSKKVDLKQKIDDARRKKAGEPLGFDGYRLESADDMIKLAELEIAAGEIHLDNYKEKQDQEGVKHYTILINKEKNRIKKIKQAVAAKKK
jgi:chromosome segregation ATPase